MKIRSFIAIELPDHVAQSLDELQRRLKLSGVPVSWTRPEQIHLTLQFLGDVEEDTLAKLADVLRDAYRGLTPFEIDVSGVGGFPSLRRPNVLWVGLREVPEPLHQAHAIADKAARALGLPTETRAFKPHLTLARVREPKSAAPLVALLEKERDFAAGTFPVRSVSLFTSKLNPKGAIHTRIEEFTF